MEPLEVTLPELAFVASTRAAGAAGAALLLADSLGPRQRRVLGWSLLAVGLVTTIPIACALVGAVADE